MTFIIFYSHFGMNRMKNTVYPTVSALYSLLFISFFTLFLAACGSDPIKKAPLEAKTPVVPAWVSQTQQLINSQQVPTAQFILDSQQFDTLSQKDKAWFVYLNMQANLAIKANENALEWLAPHWSDWLNHLPKPQFNQAKLSAASIREANFLYLPAIRERIFIDAQLNKAQQQINHDQIWQDFQQLSSEQLTQLSQFQGYSELGAWAELAGINQQYKMSLPQLSQALKQWKTKYSNYSAASLPPLKLLPFIQGNIQTPKKIAILLPKQGQFERLGNAIADGYLHAWYQNNSQEDMELFWFDTADNASADKLYQRAVNSGADIVIGPLQKDKIAQINSLPYLPIPVLALNKAVDQPLKDLYQFALLPEDEAKQLAQQAWLNGKKTAAIIAMKSSWGERVNTAFTNEFRALGGTVVASHRFDSNKPNEALPPVQQMLGIKMSDARKGYLERTIAKPVTMEARFRKDVDFIFLAALPEQGRLIRPMFDFLLAAEIPVYSISTIWNPQGNNEDLNGVSLLAPPWNNSFNHERLTLEKTIGELGRENRLYALGVDAYLLQQHIWYLQRLTEHTITGFTGRLSLDDSGVVHRELQWMEITEIGNEHRLIIPQSDVPFMEK
jgi:uncharacterized protein